MSKVKKKRVGFVLDMTPLVDITFLLLTFFMFTAKFKSENDENKVVIKRPNTVADTAKLPDKNLVNIKIGIDTVTKDTAYYISVTDDEAVQKFRQAMSEKNFPNMNSDQKTFKVSDSVWLYNTLLAARNSNYAKISDVKFAIDADSRLRFFWINQLVNTLRKVQINTFYFVTEKKQG